MESHPRRDNFERAGELWMKVWTIAALTCFTQHNSSVRLSILKYAYSTLAMCALLAAAYFRFQIKIVGSPRVILTLMQMCTIYSSLVNSAALVGLTMLNQKIGVGMIFELYQLRRKYSFVSSRSVLSYFPASCILPCLVLLVQNISFSAVSPAAVRFPIMTANCFTFYSFIFCAKIRYYLSVVEDGFGNLNNRLQALETTVDCWMTASLQLSDKLPDIKSDIQERGTITSRKLQQLRLMYHELFDFSRRINGFFASRIILVVIHTFTLGVLYTYNSISEYFHPSVNNDGVPYWLGFANWAVCCIINFFVLVHPFESIVNEGKYTAVVVQSLSSRSGYTKEVYDELRLFSSQLISEDIHFAPNNFLILNKGMLPSVLGAMCSALAIILQMSMGDD